jgi:hypothetical protein
MKTSHFVSANEIAGKELKKSKNHFKKELSVELELRLKSSPAS